MTEVASSLPQPYSESENFDSLEQPIIDKEAIVDHYFNEIVNFPNLETTITSLDGQQIKIRSSEDKYEVGLPDKEIPKIEIREKKTGKVIAVASIGALILAATVFKIVSSKRN